MSNLSRRAVEAIRGREAPKVLAEEARLESECIQLQERLLQYARFYADRTQAALERLERNGFPDGKVYELSGAASELAGWKLPNRNKWLSGNDSYYLMSDSNIYDLTLPAVGRYTSWSWEGISPTNVRYDAMESFKASKNIKTGLLIVRNAESIVERCNLICPDQ